MNKTFKNRTVVETTESRESSNEKYLETLKKLEYLEHTVSTYELKQTAAEHTIQRWILLKNIIILYYKH